MRFFRRTPKSPPLGEPEPPNEAVDGTADVLVEVEMPLDDAGASDEDMYEHEIEERTERALERTKKTWFGRMGSIFSRGEIDEALWEDLEELLLGADAGVATTMRILDDVRERVASERIKDVDGARAVLKQELIEILRSPGPRGSLWSGNGASQPKPGVILVLGVNGTGKTTSIAKLAREFQREGSTVVIAAGDTFRAAAIDQMKEWGERVGSDVIAHKQGADPGAVVFDALAAAESRGADFVIIDTAGRLHTKFNLMEELRKLRRIIERTDPSAPHEVLLVLDATTGQNAMTQAQAFAETADVTGVCLTKLDGTSKGGIVFAICDQMGIPVRFVGTGERPEDLAPFSPEAFVEALFR
jgi:fused signal recognition particle receptor